MHFKRINTIKCKENQCFEREAKIPEDKKRAEILVTMLQEHHRERKPA